MTAGALRYRRTLGYLGEKVPGQEPSATINVPAGEPGADSNAVERILGLDAYGRTTPAGGKGVFVAMAPSTLLGILVGGMLGVMASGHEGRVAGALKGAVGGALVATGIRTAAHYGV